MLVDSSAEAVQVAVRDRYAELEKAHLHGFRENPGKGGHWNESEHKVAVELIAKYICRRFHVYLQ